MIEGGHGSTRLAAHHTHDGLYFARDADGSVFVWLVWDEDGSTVKRTVKLGPNEWESVVREMEVGACLT